MGNPLCLRQTPIDIGALVNKSKATVPTYPAKKPEKVNSLENEIRPSRLPAPEVADNGGQVMLKVGPHFLAFNLSENNV
ncbi:MAG: hypothetical protein AAB965_03895 [Patescibacteria group bacterium]